MLYLIAGIVLSVLLWRGIRSKPVVIRKYQTLLRRTLELDFGAGPTYRATDVTRALLKSHVPTKFSRYAYAMYCNRAEFAKAPGCSDLSYHEIRKEIPASR
jgi:hypothetical protein